MRFMHKWQTSACAVLMACAGAASAQISQPVVQTVSTQGIVNGRHVAIEVLVASRAVMDVPALNAVATAAARKDGAEISDGFTTEFTAWPQFFDKTHSNNSVAVFYNPNGEPVAGALTAVQAALASWNSVKGSTFRYAFGGVTTRTPTVGDGFNDVAFVRSTDSCDLSIGCVLGSTYIDSDDKTGATLGIDIKLYNYVNSPFTWFINPPAQACLCYDVQSVLVHEFGHGAGIGHTWDLGAVMYPFLFNSEVRRELTLDEMTALAFLYPMKPAMVTSAGSASDKHNFNLLAALGSPAPGGGTYVDHFELGPGGVNKNGDAVFAADVDIPGGKEVLFLASNGGVARLLSPGQTISGVVLGDHTITYSSLNDAGGVGVTWAAYPGDYRAPYGIDSAVLVRTSSGPFQAVVVPRVTPVPGGGFFYGAADLWLSQTGDTAFLGLVKDNASVLRLGVFLAPANGPIVAVARPGDLAPGGGVFRAATSVSMASQGGYVAFAANTTGPGGKGIFLSDTRRGQVVKIAGIGDPAVGGGTILGLTNPRVNSKGDVLFGVVTHRLYGIVQYDMHLYSNGTLTSITKAGDVLADGRILGDVVNNSWSLTDGGDVAYQANVGSRQNYFDSPFSPRTGYYTAWNGSTQYVVRQLDNLFGIPPVLDMTGNVAIGGHGDVVFSVRSYFNSVDYLIRASPKVYAH